eukprot:1326860-Rhodomonas_salina.1
MTRVVISSHARLTHDHESGSSCPQSIDPYTEEIDYVRDAGSRWELIALGVFVFAVAITIAYAAVLFQFQVRLHSFSRLSLAQLERDEALSSDRDADSELCSSGECG